VEPASAILTETDCAGVVIHDPSAVSGDPFAAWPDHEPAPATAATLCRVSGYLPVDDRLEPALGELRARLEVLRECGLDMPDEITVRTIAEEAWADAWKAFYKPMRLGRRFVVKPTWESWEPAPEDLIIEIDPGMAFGTGSHATTRLCLELLTGLAPGGPLVDAGCGSGVLAIAAARLGWAPVLALDHDPLAVEATIDNARVNGVALRARRWDLREEPLPAAPTVLANLLRPLLLILELAETPRTLIASGLLAHEGDEVAAHFAARGLREVRRVEAEGWIALDLRHQAA
jgi:ribosomal protein L11 methyltransferase